MNFEDLFARRASHIKPGLERIRKSYEALSHPASRIPSVLIGGTNGKGSTSGFIFALLSLSEIRPRIALYSSPHLVEFSERFQLSHKKVSDEVVKTAYEKLLNDLPAECNAELSFFEIATLLGFRLFESEQADFQVLEVGLGGRWDATNISDPEASIVVSVSKDHKDYLGDDVIGILKEKFAIARPGRPLFWGAQGEVMQDARVKDAVKATVKELGAELFTRGEEFWAAQDRLHIRLPGLKALDLPLDGIFARVPEYLKQNLSLAAAFYHWHQCQAKAYDPLETIWPKFCEGQTPAPVTLAGRAQRVASREGAARRFLIDVCHNPDGARAFAAAVKKDFGSRKLPAYVSILKDKDCDNILDILRSVLSPVILFGIESDRTWGKASLASRHQDLPFFGSLEAAFASDLSKAKQGEPWAICGSVAAVGHALTTMKVSPKDLSLASIISGDWSPSPQSDKPQV